MDIEVASQVIDAIAAKDADKAIDILTANPQLDVNTLVPSNNFDASYTWVPLHAAAYYGQRKVIDVLVTRNADIEKHDTWYGATAIGWAAFADDDKTARHLLKYKANPVAKNIHGQTPVELVADRKDKKWRGIFTYRKHKQPKYSDSESDAESQTSNASRRKSTPSNTAATHTPTKTPQQTAQQTALHDRAIQIHRNMALDQPQPTEPYTGSYDQAEFMRELWAIVINHTDPNGRGYCEIFQELPSREELPEYYEVIQEPICFDMIEERMKTGAYPNLARWERDMNKLFEDAMYFNELGSRIFKDGKLLQRLYLRHSARLLNTKDIGNVDTFMLAPLNRPVYVDPPLDHEERLARRSQKGNRHGYEFEEVKWIPKSTPRKKPRSESSQGRNREVDRLRREEREPNRHRERELPSVVPSDQNGRQQRVRKPPDRLIVAPVPSRPAVSAPQTNRETPQKTLPDLSYLPPQPQIGQTPSQSFPFIPTPTSQLPMASQLAMKQQQGYHMPGFDMLPQHAQAIANGIYETQPDNKTIANGVPKAPVAIGPNVPRIIDYDIPDIPKAPALLKSIQVETNERSFAMAFDTFTTAHSITIASFAQTMTFIPILDPKLLQSQAQVALTVEVNRRRIQSSDIITFRDQPAFRHEVFYLTPKVGLNVIDCCVNAMLNADGSSGVQSQHFYLFISRLF
ncbi:hypothetical protein BZG36_02637 [Bifiguratus adelaidae]|uniref:Bromo domain-containing protein n=1 Tax=Bifiguratus adelaidae TaxID=1938954 RepID=A0A261Y2X5_9FUNG|nr:hypothetical protein BZG36_02637 [Bifiguratus adelaidae]